MKVKDIDVKIISDILKELPEYMEVTKISLTNGYQVHMVAGTEQIKDYDRDIALNELMCYIRENKNYLIKSDKTLDNAL